jgi:hypothetical protein
MNIRHMLEHQADRIEAVLISHRSLPMSRVGERLLTASGMR